MSEFFFFTDPDLLIQQTANQAFGPVPGQEQTHYKLTSEHYTSAQAPAIAVCKGFVFIQTQPNGSLNLILIPLEQPDNGMPTVRYFIYRGLDASSLLDGNFVASSASNDLTALVWDDHNTRLSGVQQQWDTDEYDESSEFGDGPSADVLGTSMQSFPGTQDINEMLYRQPYEYESPIMEAGDHMGDFAWSTADSQWSCGLEIAFANDDGLPTFDQARAATNIYSVSALSNSSTEAETMDHKFAKEKVLHWIDPAAYFGAFAGNGLKITNLGTGAPELLSIVELYNRVIKHYFNKNKLYIDIRNHYGFSHNFFETYGNAVQLSLGTSSNYHELTPTFGDPWPIIQLDASTFPLQGPNYDLENQYGTRMELGLEAGSNLQPIWYLSKVPTAPPSGNTLDVPTDAHPADRWEPSTQDVDFGSLVTFNVPYSNENPQQPYSDHSGFTPSANNASIATYVRVYYFRTAPPIGFARKNPETIYEVMPGHFADTVFTPFRLDVPFPGFLETGEEKMNQYVSEKEVLVDTRGSEGKLYVGKQGIAFDEKNVTLFVFPISKWNPEGTEQGITPPAVSSVQEDRDFIYTVTLAEKSIQAVKVTPSNPSDNGAPYLSLERKIGFGRALNRVDPDDWLTITISREQFNALDALATSAAFTSWSPVFLGFEPIPTDEIDGQKVTDQGKLLLRGYTADTSGNVTLTEVPSTIYVYARYE